MDGHTDDIKAYRCRCYIKISTVCFSIHPTPYRTYEERKLTNSQWYGSHRRFKRNVFSSPSIFATSSCLQKSTVEEVHNLHPPSCAVHLTASRLPSVSNSSRLFSCSGWVSFSNWKHHVQMLNSPGTQSVLYDRLNIYIRRHHNL